MSRILSAVAWPYANGPRHIGHVAGFGVPSDVFSRYMRMAGHDVLMVSGTDEHGTPILVQSEREGVTPAGARRPLQPGHRRGPRAVGTHLRPLHAHHHGQPLRGGSGALHARVTPTATWWRRPRAARSRRRPAAPFPTATSRARAPSVGRTARAATSATTAATSSTPSTSSTLSRKINGETPKFVETEHFFLDLPALADRARGVAGRPPRLAPQRAQLLAEPAEGRATARDDARHRLGHPGAARWAGRTTPTSVSTCGSTPSSAT